ncbi:MAG: DUF2007 domain-containing protein [Acidobacteriota bacterium]
MEQPKSALPWVEVIETNDLTRLGMLRDILRQSGIDSFIRSENFTRLYGSLPILGNPALMVQPEDYEQALEVLGPFLGEGGLFEVPEVPEEE